MLWALEAHILCYLVPSLPGTFLGGETVTYLNDEYRGRTSRCGSVPSFVENMHPGLLLGPAILGKACDYPGMSETCLEITY